LREVASSTRVPDRDGSHAEDPRCHADRDANTGGALTGAGPLSSQIALNADGTFATGFFVAFTGTNATGALVNNCADYSTKASASLTNEMYVIWKDFSAMWGQTYCNQIGKLACFEQ
jgi:hypothetical protein